MNNLFRALIAGYGAKKLGGGCFSTVLVFVLLWVLLGQCGSALPPPDSAAVDAAPPAVETVPARAAAPAVALVPAG